MVRTPPDIKTNQKKPPNKKNPTNQTNKKPKHPQQQ